MKFIYQDRPIHVDILEDDTIEHACYQLAEVLGCEAKDIYLFTKQETRLTPRQIYERLIPTFGKIEAFHYHNFLLCLNKPIPKIVKKEYTQEDFDFMEVLLDIPLGQTIPCAVDPSKVVHPEYYEKVAIQQEYRKLFVDYMPFFEDSIYVCCQRDYAVTLYFNHTLLPSTPSISKLFVLGEPLVLEEGITYLSCELESEPIQLPLDTIFQLIHVSKDIPMIQYNSGKEETILYKLYTEQEDLHGNKIPFLPANEVLKHDQSYKHAITVFFKDGVKYAFHENGSIFFEVKGLFTIDEIDAMIHKHSDTMAIVSQFMYESGHVYPLFRTIRDTKVHSLSYKMAFPVKEWNEHDCTSMLFVDIGTNHRYRRISLFYESELIQEICLTDFLQEKTKAFTVKKLIDVFHMSKESATQVVDENYQVIENLIRDGKKVSVKHKIGLPTMIQRFATDVQIKIDAIPSLFYLPSVIKNIKAYVGLRSIKNTIRCSTVVEAPVARPFVFQYDKPDEPEDDFEIEEPEFEIDYSGGFSFKQYGGKDPDLVVNNPNFTIHRIMTVKQYYEGYTRNCPLKRRPIALIRESEREAAKAKNVPTYVHQDVPYICPMYWDMEEKVPLTQEEVDVLITKGKRVIDDNLKGEVNPARDGSIFRLSDGSHPYPGPLEDGGVCCFKKKYYPKVKDDRKPVESKLYINTHETSLADEGKVSYVSKPLRSFFQLSEECEIEPQRYLLRYGVEKPATFLHCIEACFKVSYPGKFNHDTFLQILLHHAKKRFASYQNGNLIRQFETFEAFEKEFRKEQMDYTLLWDIVSETMQVNLVILRVPDDIHVEFICTPFLKFDKGKNTIFIFEQTVQGKVCYEPLIDHNVKKDAHTILMNYYVHSTLQPAFDQIASVYLQCNDTRSNLVASVLYPLLPKGTSQVVHQYKCIGFSVENVFIPCYPSAALSIPTVEMPLSTFEHTLFVLTKYSKVVPCKPYYKVIKDGIQGILTETNSFVPCLVEADHDTSLPIYPHRIQHEYMNIPKKTKLIQKADAYLYSSLRRKLKAVLTPSLRKELNMMISKKQVHIQWLDKILKGHLLFVEPVEEGYLKEIVRCKGSCSAMDKLILPKLVYKDYLPKLANELNHYKRISSFVIKSQLMMPELPYSLQDQEMILVHSMADAYYQELTEPKRIPSQFDTVSKDVDTKLYVKVKKLYYIII
jgi:hypothetical protein